MAEKVVRIGAFFDGTGGNKANDEKIDDGSLTNIPKLEEIYRLNGYEHLYEEGVGTREYRNGKTFTDKQIEEIRATGSMKKIDFYNTTQLAIATEAKGISDSMMAQIDDKIKDIRDKDPNAKIVVDVYGFSRGAAEARDFVNSFNEKYGKDESVRTDFVGLYDTVTSVGTKSDLYNGGLNLNLGKDSANSIVHLTASDEKRYNFPLHSLKDKDGNLPNNIKEIGVYGVHGDVGGGDARNYTDKITQKYGVKTYDREFPIQKESARAEIIAQATNLGYKEGDIHISEQEGIISTMRYVLTNDVSKTNELGRAGLHIMINEIEKHGIPLPNKNANDKDYALPENLKEYVNAVAEGKDISPYKEAVQPYVSISGGNLAYHKGDVYKDDFAMALVNVNKNEREVFDNKADKAVAQTPQNEVKEAEISSKKSTKSLEELVRDEIGSEALDKGKAAGSPWGRLQITQQEYEALEKQVKGTSQKESEDDNVRRME
jgi:hypothetical protein